MYETVLTWTARLTAKRSLVFIHQAYLAEPRFGHDAEDDCQRTRTITGCQLSYDSYCRLATGEHVRSRGPSDQSREPSSQ
jgi:hypothetical protein